MTKLQWSHGEFGVRLQNDVAVKYLCQVAVSVS